MAFPIAIVAGVSIAVGLSLYALNQNINQFFSANQLDNEEVSVGQHIRAGGMVVNGSIEREQESLKVHFDLTDYESIVPQGAMNAEGVFEASEVLAKHDENYMPQEVKDALDAAGKTADGQDIAPEKSGGQG
tara:strand:- start:15028 stop:15423 length:396 start_codon:yes stop_codon:yes gene_type:complete